MGSRGFPIYVCTCITYVRTYVRTYVCTYVCTCVRYTYVRAGSNLRGTVNHSKNWRNPETGYHSNDIESEFARFKLFLRTKYDWVRATNNKNPVLKDLALERKMAEYVFYTNVGRTMAHVMEAFRYSGGY